jgi:hypothetical protein
MGLFLCSVVRDILWELAHKIDRRRVDYLGSVILALFIVLLLVGLNSRENQIPWRHPPVWSAISPFLTSFATFTYVELYAVQEPIMPLHLLLKQTVWSGCMATSLPR